MITNKTIFISALDWGLGHAARCVQVIRDLEKNNKIIIGVTPLTQLIFDEEFPHLQKINVPAYEINYSKILPLWLKLFFSRSKILKIIEQENKLLNELISKNKIDIVISDNRFGMYSKKIKSVFITHQLFLKAPIFSALAQKINKKFILNFNEVWVPDFAENKNSLSAELSHGQHFHSNVKYIGPLSRLEKLTGVEKKYDYLFLISGPEPQQTIFKDLLIEKTKNYPNLKFAIATPKHETRNTEQETKNVECFICPDKKTLSRVIAESKKIICRSGYSTLMDLHFLEKKEIILVPTPGQTEQEYLAKYWKEKFNCVISVQKNIPDLKF